MSYFPMRTYTNSSKDIINAIRNDASFYFRENVSPILTDDAEDIRKVGAVISNNPQLLNEFANTLINRIAKVVILSKMYENPWKVFKKGVLDYGETVEAIFVDLVDAQDYNPEIAETELFKRELPDIRTSFAIRNFEKFYKTTYSQQDLKSAFLTQDGVSSLVVKITEALYKSLNKDEYLVMKYIVGKSILEGKFKSIDISSAQNTADIVTEIIAESDNLETELLTDANVAGVFTSTPKEDQYLICTNKFHAKMNVDVLATAFHMEKAEFMGHIVKTKSFSFTEDECKRLDNLFKDADWYEPFYNVDNNTWNQIKTDFDSISDYTNVVLVDKDFFQIYDNLYEVQDVWNGQGLYWNLILHSWKTFGVSPFANAEIFNAGTQSITSVSVSPTAATLTPGGSINLQTTVVATAFASKAVRYTSSNTAVATVDGAGNVKVLPTATKGATATITVKSVFDSTKTATSVITVA